ncbi:MAG TPA: four helix bundle protein [Vicinamibacterales bacterium]|nr:four helix bundle protein [Vicinamibacterales bacterium]
MNDYAERSFAFACDIVRLYRALEPRVPTSMARQVLKSGTSIGANLEEARAASSRKDLTEKFAIALREARETRYWLRLFIATALVPAELVSAELSEANELVAILTTSVKRLRARKGSEGT